MTLVEVSLPVRWLLKVGRKVGSGGCLLLELPAEGIHRSDLKGELGSASWQSLKPGVPFPHLFIWQISAHISRLSSCCFSLMAV